MAIGRPKKMMNMYILEILNRYTDKDHRISQKEIQNKLEYEYEMMVDRKAVKANILDLIEAKYPIGYEVTTRVTPNSKTGKLEESEIYSDFYIERDFTDAEIRLIIDSLMFSKHIPNNHKKDLINKLVKLSSKYFKANTKYIENINTVTSQNYNLLLNIDVIDEAIDNKRQIAFTYNKYCVDKKLYPIFDNIIVNPLKISVANDHYYLICNDIGTDKINHYRIDKITNINILDSLQLKDSKKTNINYIDISDYLSSHMNMICGDSEKIVFSVEKSAIEIVIDQFGDKFNLLETRDNEYVITVKSNLFNMYYWVMQYSDYITIIEPIELSNKIRDAISKTYQKYISTEDKKYKKALENAKESNLLVLNGIDLRNREEFKVLTNLESLNLEHNNLHDISFLTNFDKLRNLEIRSNSIIDFNPIKELKKLNTLGLYNTGINDISFLRQCNCLKVLILQEDKIQNLSPLYELHNLSEIRLNKKLGNNIDYKKIKKNNPEIKIWTYRGSKYSIST